MQFSLNNNNNILEKDFNNCLQPSKSQANGIPCRRSSQITSPSSDSSINQSPFIELEPIDITSFPLDTLMTPQIETTSTNEDQIQNIMETVLTGNKNKIQSKKEFINTLKNIKPDNFIEYLKTVGEKMFNDNDTQNSNQLTSPITTPSGNALMDLNVNLFNSPVTSTISSPEIISPIQPNINTLDLLVDTTNVNTISNTPVVNTVFSEPLIVVQDELNPFKSPTTVSPSPNVQNPISLITPSPLMQSPLVSSIQSPLLTSLITNTPIQQTIQSPLISTPVQQIIQSPIISTPIIQPNINSDLSNILDTISQQSSLVSSTDSIITSPVMQNPSPASTPLLPIDSTPVLPNEPIQENSNCLEKVDFIMKVVNDIMKNKENTQASSSSSSSSSISTLNNNSDVNFPSLETIKQCIVNKYNFDFNNVNINKLVRLAPVEFVQEDVIELQKLANQKRGKGRPRKPRKFTICPFANCHKKFNREYNLKEHIRIHNPKRNRDYVCHICDEGFLSSSVLSRHMSSVHQGEKFPCKYCGRKFNRRDALHRHKKITCL